MDIWNSFLGEELPLRREPENVVDEQAVAITKDSQVVGHVAIEFPSILFHFLARPCNKGIAKVTGRKINQGAGHGLEISCVLRLYGPPKYLERLQQLLDKAKNRCLYFPGYLHWNTIWDHT